MKYRTRQIEVEVELQDGQCYSEVTLPNKARIFVDNSIITIFFEPIPEPKSDQGKELTDR